MMGIRQICHGDGWWRVMCSSIIGGVVMVVIPNTYKSLDVCLE